MIKKEFHVFDWCYLCSLVVPCYENSNTPKFLEPACGEEIFNVWDSWDGTEEDAPPF